MIPMRGRQGSHDSSAAEAPPRRMPGYSFRRGRWWVEFGLARRDSTGPQTGRSRRFERRCAALCRIRRVDDQVLTRQLFVKGGVFGLQMEYACETTCGYVVELVVEDGRHHGRASKAANHRCLRLVLVGPFPVDDQLQNPPIGQLLLVMDDLRIGFSVEVSIERSAALEEFIFVRTGRG